MAGPGGTKTNARKQSPIGSCGGSSLPGRGHMQILKRGIISRKETVPAGSGTVENPNPYLKRNKKTRKKRKHHQEKYPEREKEKYIGPEQEEYLFRKPMRSLVSELGGCWPFGGGEINLGVPVLTDKGGGWELLVERRPPILTHTKSETKFGPRGG